MVITKRRTLTIMLIGALMPLFVVTPITLSGAATFSTRSSGGMATVALDEDLTGFNIDTSAASSFVLQEIMNMVWPQAFIVNNSLQPVLNTQLLLSAVQTADTPQTIVYTLNPKATWSDGTPITADDFIYNWQAQSGNPAYADLGGKPYDADSTAGYSQIASVVGSDPSDGVPCVPGTVTQRNLGLCPNGRTVTITFRPSFTDWRSLFTNIVPAHLSRVVGWNAGFTGPAHVISGSWFKIQSYSENQSLVLVRNPAYWGTPAKLNKLVFEFFSDDAQMAPALQNHEIDAFNPTSVSLSMVQAANQVPNSTKVTVPGLSFEHLDFNQDDPYLSKLQVREAIAHGIDRQAMIIRTVGEIAKGVKPLGSRMLMPTQPGYDGTNFSYNVHRAMALLQGLGFKRGSDGYFQPNYGPEKGRDLTFTIQSTAGNTIRTSTEEVFQAQMKDIGIRINIQNYDANTLFGSNLPNGEYQIAEFAWYSTPFVSANQAIYCSYTDADHCDLNWTHSANTQVDKLMAQGAAAPSTSAEIRSYNQADAILWRDMVTLPLYQSPLLFVWSNDLKGVLPNASNVGLTWNAQDWTTTAR